MNPTGHETGCLCACGGYLIWLESKCRICGRANPIFETMNSPITKLPDGSAFFTATVMSREEAMALPVEQRPICYRISSQIYHAIFASIGAASLCWNPIPVGDFDSAAASKIAADLCLKIAEELKEASAPPKTSQKP